MSKWWTEPDSKYITQFAPTREPNTAIGGFFSNAFGIKTPRTKRFEAQEERYIQQLYSWNQAATARAYNLAMSNTAVQRRMEDLQAAGINPILAGQNAASTPTSPTAAAQQAHYDSSNFFEKILNTALTAVTLGLIKKSNIPNKAKA